MIAEALRATGKNLQRLELIDIDCRTHHLLKMCLLNLVHSFDIMVITMTMTVKEMMVIAMTMMIAIKIIPIASSVR